MFYMPKYHNLPDGRQVFLRFPDPARHADAVSALLAGVPAGAEGAAFLSQANAHPMKLVLVADEVELNRTKVADAAPQFEETDDSLPYDTPF